MTHVTCGLIAKNRDQHRNLLLPFPFKLMLLVFCCYSCYAMVTVVGPCPAYWYYYADTDCCFYMSTIKLSLLAARLECLHMGGDLASIADQEEMDFLLSFS